jgi:hypothetical protein
MDFIEFGSSLSMRGLMRCGGDLSVQNRILLGGTGTVDQDTYIHYTTGSGAPTPAPYGIQAYVAGSRALGLVYFGSPGVAQTFAGGIMHGVWYADMLVAPSDRRLKTNTKPLVDSLRKMGEYSQ